VFLPAGNNGIYFEIMHLQLFGVQDDVFIGIFQKIGQYRSQNMVTVG
jgi:hypothetical protein